MVHTWWCSWHCRLSHLTTPQSAVFMAPQVDLPNQSLALLHSALTTRFVTALCTSCVVPMIPGDPYGNPYYTRNNPALCSHHRQVAIVPAPRTLSQQTTSSATSYLRQLIFRHSPSGSNAAKHGVHKIRCRQMGIWSNREIIVSRLFGYISRGKLVNNESMLLKCWLRGTTTGLLVVDWTHGLPSPSRLV